jgi:hypothetical protein
LVLLTPLIDAVKSNEVTVSVEGFDTSTDGLNGSTHNPEGDDLFTRDKSTAPVGSKSTLA